MIANPNIFCLETEWNQSVRNLMTEPTAVHLLEFLQKASTGWKTTISFDFVFRQVATLEDFEYYISHLYVSSYEKYGIVYLAFHGDPGVISLPNKTKIDLLEFAENHKGIFKNRYVHFGSCSTLDIWKSDIEQFKKCTEAKIVTGYKVDIDFKNSFIFELWLMQCLQDDKYTAESLMTKAKEEMRYFVKTLKFFAL